MDSPPSPLFPSSFPAFTMNSPPPMHEALTSVDLGADHQPSLTSPSISLRLSLLIVAAIIVVVVVMSACIHLLLRFLSFRRGSSSSVVTLPLPRVLLNSGSSSSGAAATEAAAESTLSDQMNAALIDSLPVFSLASALSTLPKSSPDCAVCLSPFYPHDELRLLPACCHAFHSSCVDTWLRSTPSCPLCRTSIGLPTQALPLPPPAGDPDTSRSGSFRIEIGSVSRRRTTSEEEPGNPPPLPPHQRAYSIGSSFEYLVEEEMEAVVARITRRTELIEKRRESDSSTDAIPAPPREWVAEEAGGGVAGGFGWLREYVDRLAMSASTSFSSLRLSERWSHLYDGEDTGGEGQNSWDLEATTAREAEESADYGFYRWFVGA
ncbi:E3 ubiquitin-protein ligase [Canna indica]|uniref:E3 ubiquitin-protein ligase n=1 Tax=Canna indica TaxID=4628 RepID=A0AAQ3K0N7_9LILI|nr:E3 ubiquitin-protein ligase [Canna indica]